MLHFYLTCALTRLVDIIGITQSKALNPYGCGLFILQLCEVKLV